MRILKYLTVLFCIVTSSRAFSQIDFEIQSKYEVVSNFTEMELIEEDVTWAYLSVPEDWGNSKSTKIKLAVAIIKSHKKDANKAAIFLQGGPGGSEIIDIFGWINSPIRDLRDIILVDVRGTGFSTPNLCPDLGGSFMKILAEDYSVDEEISARVAASLECRDDLFERNININSYNSNSIAYDLHALKEHLPYNKWMVYGVSYGTKIALQYAKMFSNDIDKLLLDSPIPEGTGYYDNLTSNYVRSLDILFAKCNNDKECVNQYGDLKKIFYETIISYQEQPLTVEVSKDVHPSGRFLFNAQDFVMAVQQGLYDRYFFEVLPLMIQEFNNRNEDMISALVTALSSRLSLDYGMYYCTLCNESIKLENKADFESDASQYKGFISRGLPFYFGDFSVCNNWFNVPRVENTIMESKEETLENVSTLIISGEFDPITPPKNGKLLTELIPNSRHVVVSNQGHTPSFLEPARSEVIAFMDSDSKTKISSTADSPKLNFATGIQLNSGVNKFANSLMKVELSILIPLVLVLLVFLTGAVSLPIILRKNWSKLDILEKKISMVSLLMSFLGMYYLIALVLAILNTANSNFYVLAFGLPKHYGYLLFGPYFLLILTMLAIFSYSRKKKHKFLKLTNIITLASIVLLIEVFYLGIYFS